MPTVNWTVRPSATARVVVHGHGNGAVALGKETVAIAAERCTIKGAHFEPVRFGVGLWVCQKLQPRLSAGTTFQERTAHHDLDQPGYLATRLQQHR
jgi:hypothetical protein